MRASTTALPLLCPFLSTSLPSLDLDMSAGDRFKHGDKTRLITAASRLCFLPFTNRVQGNGLSDLVIPNEDQPFLSPPIPSSSMRTRSGWSPMRCLPTSATCS